MGKTDPMDDRQAEKARASDALQGRTGGANAEGRTIGLCMIVKNESRVILRCLESVRPLVDYVLIADTGSTDGTQAIVREWLDRTGLPGEVVEEPWRDFAYNRSHALAKLRENKGVDYALVIDADDQLVADADFDVAAFKESLSQDLYKVQLRNGLVHYQRDQVCSNKREFRYRGVLHEFMEGPPDGASSGIASGFHILSGREGARSEDPDKYRKDAQVLEQALQAEQDTFLRSRYTFYLARSYRDAGEKEKALETYLKRAGLGFWQDEVFITLYQAAQMMEQLGHSDQEVLDAYLRAADALPTRAEALHGASRFCRYKGRNEEGYQIAKRGLDISMPSGALFVEPWIYETGLLDEFAVNAYWSGHNRDCLDASLRILATGKLSGTNMQRVIANAQLASKRLPGDPKLGSRGAEELIKQHSLPPPRPLRSHLVGSPRVLIAILAKQKEPFLPFYLECVEALDYPKSSIVLYIRTNNNTDGTARILREWVARVDHLYAGVEFDAEDVAPRVEQFGVHEWNATRFRVLGRIRNVSLQKTLEHGCQFYFVSDVDIFIRPCTLRELVALNLPIVAPFLRSIIPGQLYSNYHAEIDANGYYKDCDQYQWVLNRHIRGVIEMPVVHCTYLVRSDVIQNINYVDMTDRHEYVTFSDSARRSMVDQYLDNRQIYGYVTFDENEIRRARALLRDDIDLNRSCLDRLFEIQATLSLLTPYAVPGLKKIRIGHDSDGGYVMLNDLDHEIVCYNLGIGTEISWDLELANRGALIFQFDDSVDGPPVSHPNFRFRRVRIGAEDNPQANTIKLNTLIRSSCSLQNRYAILNMDIEGSEWAVIESADSETLSEFSQIIIEFHGLDRLNELAFNRFVRGIFQKLYLTHFPIHVHGNNWGKTVSIGDFECPGVLEVTFVSRAIYTGSRDFTTYPTIFDKPCKSDRPDLDLGRFPFGS